MFEEPFTVTISMRIFDHDSMRGSIAIVMIDDKQSFLIEVIIVSSREMADTIITREINKDNKIIFSLRLEIATDLLDTCHEIKKTGGEWGTEAFHLLA